MCIPVWMTLTLTPLEGFTLVLIMWLQPSLLGTSLLAPHRDGPRKGGLNKACLTPTWLASRGQWASLPSGKKNERKKKTANLKVTCWNSHTVEDSEDHPQWRSALVARELAWLDIDITVEVAFSAKYALLNKASSGKMEQALPFSGLGRTRIRTASPASASWSKLPLPENCRTCQLVIQTTSCPYNTQSRTTSLPLSSVFMHILCRLKLE